MKFILDNIALILIFLCSGGWLLWLLLQEGWGGRDRVSVADAVALINRQKAVLIDVGSPKEFAQAHAKGAKNVPLDVLQQGLGKAVKNKGTPVVFMCPVGKRSVTAARAARKMGYAQAVSLDRGLKAWREAQLPVQQDKEKEKA